MIQRDTDNNRTEDKDILIKREKNRIKRPHVKDGMSKRLDSLEAGAYCTTARFLSITMFDSNHCIRNN